MGLKEKIKLTFLRLFDNYLSKISYFQKNFLHAMFALGYLAKLKRGLGLTCGACFLYDFSIKMFYI